MKALEVGEIAPELYGTNEKGESVALKDYHGKKLVLFFYPKDNTPGCTAAACSIRDHYGELKTHGVEALGVSTDDTKSHTKFIDKYSFPFPLLADVEHKTAEAYGVWGPKKFMGKEYIGMHRTTFVIDEEGKIEHIFTKVKTKTHAEQILEYLNA